MEQRPTRQPETPLPRQSQPSPYGYRQLSHPLPASGSRVTPNLSTLRREISVSTASSSPTPSPVPSTGSRGTLVETPQPAQTPPPPSAQPGQAAIRAVLADPVLRAQVQELFAASQVQTRLVQFLQDPTLQEVTVQLLAQPEMTQTARALFQSQPEALPAAVPLLSQPTTGPALLEMLNRPEMQVVAQQVVTAWTDEAASSGEALQRLATVLQTPEGRAVLNQTLEAHPQQVSEWLNRLLTSEQTPANTETLTRFLTLPAVQKALPQFLEQASPETAGRLLTALADKAPTPVAQAILKDPAFQTQIPRLLNPSETAAPLLRLLARPDLQEESSRAIQARAPQTAQTLAKVLTQSLPRTETGAMPSSPSQPRPETGSASSQPIPSPPPNVQITRTTLELLARPELASLARQVLSVPETRQAILRQLDTPQTAEPVLTTLSKPESAPLARLVFNPPALGPSFASEGTSRPSFTTGVNDRPVSTGPAVPPSTQPQVPQTPSVPTVPPSVPSTEATPTGPVPQSPPVPPSSPQPAPSTGETPPAPVPPQISSSRGTGSTPPAPPDSAPSATTQNLPPKSIATPEAQSLERLLDLSGKTSEPQTRQEVVQQAAQALRILQQPGLETLARTLMQSPGVTQNIPTYLTTPQTRDAWVSLLTQPALASETQAQWTQPAVRDALATALASEGGPELATRLLETPAAARAVIETLASSRQLSLLDRVLSQPAQQNRLTALLTEPATRDLLLPLLSQPEMQATTRQILQSPSLAAEIGRQVENPENRTAALQILTQTTPTPAVSQTLAGVLSSPKAIASFQALLSSEATAPSPPETPPSPAVSAALKLLAQPEMARVAHEVFEAPETRQVLVQVLKQTTPSPSPEAPDTSVAPSLPKSPEEVSTILRILKQPDMIQTTRAIFSQPEARAALNQALAQLSSLPGTPTLSRTDTAMLLDILSQPEMAAIARQAFSASDARALLARVLSAPATPAQPLPTSDSVSVLRILARPEMAAVAQDVLTRPEVAARIPDLLASASTRAATLEVLIRPELTETVRSLLETPSAQTALATLLGSDKTQRQTVRLFDNPQLAQPLLSALASVKNSPQQTTVLENAHVQNLLAQTLTQEPALRAQVLQILSQARTPAPAEQLLARPEVRALLPELLESPDTRPALLNLLSRLNQQPQPSPTAQTILNTLQDPRIAEVLRNSLSTPTPQASSPAPVPSQPTPPPEVPSSSPTPSPPSSPSSVSPSSPVEAEMALRLLARLQNAGPTGPSTPVLPDPNLISVLRQSLQNATLRPAVLDILAQPSNGTLAREVLTNPETQQTLQNLLGLDTPGKTSPIEDRVSPLSGNELQALVRALNRPETVPQVRELLGNDPARFVQFIRDLANRVSTRAALDFLTRPDLQDLWSAAEKNPETRQILEKILLSPDAQTSLRALLRQPDRAIPILERLTQPENIPLAARLFEQAPVQSTASQLLAQSETRESFLRLLNQPALANATVRILNQPAVQEELATILQDASTRTLLRPLLEQPALTDTLARLLQSATQNESSGEVRQFIQEILQTLRAENPTATSPLPSQNGLFNLSLNQVLSRYGVPGLTSGSLNTSFESLKPATSSLPDASGSLPPVPPSVPQPSNVRLDALLRQTFGLSSPEGNPVLSEATLQKVEASLTHLSAVSPTRAQTALRALLLLGATETPELNGVIEQITQRLEQVATQLAQKGGLPAGQTEPALSGAPLLALRFVPLSSEQLGSLVRTLSQNGLDIQFAGRDANGNVQLHLLLVGDQPAGNTGRTALAPGAPTVHQANLSPSDLTALRQALGTNHAIEPDQPSIWTRTGTPAETTAPTVRPEIALAATALRDGERAIETLAARAGNPANPMLRPETQMPSILPPFLSAFFPWIKPEGEVRARTGGKSTQEPETPYIPSLLELVLEGPLLLPYEPGELMVPGTDIPLIFPPDYWDDGILDVAWEPVP